MTARLAFAALLATAPLAAQANSDARLEALRLFRPGQMLRLHVRRVGTLHTRLVAAPAYLARRGTPRTLPELREHEWVVYKGLESVLFQLPRGERRLPAKGRVRGDDMSFVLAATRAGVGIAVLPAFLADPEINAGTLVPVLPKWKVSSGGVWVVYPPARPLPVRVSAFRDLVAEELAAT